MTLKHEHTPIRTEAVALWKLAWPVLVGQVATVAMGVADVAMTGHASAADLAAVSLGTSVWTIVAVTVIGVMMAVNTLVAHDVGANALANIPSLVRQGLWKSLIVGLVGCVAANAVTPVFNHIGLEPDVAEMAARFVHVISIGLPAFTTYRVLYGYSAGLGQTKPTMVIALGGLLFNIAVNWLLVFGNLGFPRLGAIGCAVATSMGLWGMLLAMIWWIRRAPVYRQTDPLLAWEAPDWSRISAMLRLGLPIGVTYFAEVTAFASIALLVAPFGVVTIAAHQIALNFSSLVFMVPMSFGIALITRVGLTLGASDARQARFVAWVGVGMSIVYATGSALLITWLREPIANLYTSDTAVQLLTAELLLLAAIFQISDATQVSTACAIRGYKVTRRPMVIHLFAFWIISLPLGYALGMAPEWLPIRPSAPMGAQGFWIGLVIGLSLAAVMLSLLLHFLSRSRAQS
jgi:MATE family multidrug resistance protein